jgi:hypothetical protein
MSAIDETIVREYFEQHGFLVSQNRKYVVSAREKTPDEEIDLVVFNPHAAADAAPQNFVLSSHDLAQIGRAIVSVRGWHTEPFAPSVLTNAPDIFRFLEPQALQAAEKLLGKDGRIFKLLVVPALPHTKATRERSIEILKSKGVDGVLSFRSILEELIAGVETNRNYQKSDLLQVLRLLKNYGLIKEPQMEFRFRRKAHAKAQRRKEEQG